MRQVLRQFPVMTAIVNWMAVHTTPIGRLTLLFALINFIDLFALGSARLVIAWMLAGLLVVAYITGWSLRPQVTGRYVVPRCVTRTEPFTLRLVIDNPSPWAVWGWSFRLTDLPASWTVQAETPIVQHVAGQRHVELRWRIVAARRGEFGLRGGRIISCFPLGIFRFYQNLHSSLLVMVEPRCQPLLEMRLTGDRGWQHSQALPRLVTGQSFEFLGNRDYQATSWVRRFDFASWARLGRPIVREYQEDDEFCLGIVVMPLPNGVTYQEDQVADVLEIGEGMVELIMAIAASVTARQRQLSWICAPDGRICECARSSQPISHCRNFLATMNLDASDQHRAVFSHGCRDTNETCEAWCSLPPVDEVWIVAPWLSTTRNTSPGISFPWRCHQRTLYVTRFNTDGDVAGNHSMIDCQAISRGRVRIR